MGPTCTISFATDLGSTLAIVDSVLATAAEKVERTRKGRVWDIWMNGRPFHVDLDAKSSHIVLSAGCNVAEDIQLLRLLSAELATAVGGVASEPTK